MGFKGNKNEAGQGLCIVTVIEFPRRLFEALITFFFVRTLERANETKPLIRYSINERGMRQTRNEEDNLVDCYFKYLFESELLNWKLKYPLFHEEFVGKIHELDKLLLV